MGILLVYDVTDESSFNSKFFLLLVIVLRHSSFIILSAFLIFYNVYFFKSTCIIAASIFVGKLYFSTLYFGEIPVLKCVLRWNWLLYLFNLISYPDIKNWIRNIEQHASDNVNKILVGNKADMDESKRVCPTHSLFLQPFGFPCTLISCDYYAKLDAGNLFSLGCSNFKRSSSGRRIRHQVFWNCKQHLLLLLEKHSEIGVLFLMPRLCLCRVQKLIWMWMRFSFQ